MRIVKAAGLGGLVCPPVLGSGSLDSRCLLIKLQAYQIRFLTSLLLPMLRVSPKQLALGTHATREVPQGNPPTHTVLKRQQVPSSLSCLQPGVLEVSNTGVKPPVC